MVAGRACNSMLMADGSFDNFGSSLVESFFIVVVDVVVVSSSSSFIVVVVVFGCF